MPDPLSLDLNLEANLRLPASALTAGLDMLWVLALGGLLYAHYLLPAALLVLGVAALMFTRAHRYRAVQRRLEAATLALSASETRYRRLVDLAPDAIWTVRLGDGCILETNRGSRALYGYSEAEFRQLALADLRHPATLEELPDHLRQAATGRAAFETQHVHKDGHAFPVEVSSAAAEIGGEQVLFSIIRDITARKRLEASLHAHLSELNDLADLSTAMRDVQDQTMMAELLVTVTGELLHAPMGALALLDGARLEVIARRGADLPAAWLANDGLLRPRLPFLHPELLRAAEQPDLAAAGLAALWVAPLHSSAAPIGLLLLGYPTPYQPSASDHRLLTAIAEVAGSALSRMQMTAALEKMIIARSRELECIYQVAAAASQTGELAAALQQALAVTMAAVDAPAGGIFLLHPREDGSLEEAEVELVAQIGLPEPIYPFLADQAAENSMARWIIQNRRGRLSAPAAAEPEPGRTLAFAGLPICVHEDIIGVLGLGKADANDFNLDEMTMLSFVADHLGLVVENHRRNRQLERHAILEERSRLARELHDSVTQQLYSATLYTAGAREFAAQGRLPEVSAYLDEIGEVARRALKEMRLLVYALRLPALEEGGLAQALQNRLDTVERRSGIEANLDLGALPPLPPAVEDGLYHIAIETLNNSLKHAAASQVSLELQLGASEWQLRVADNGVGCDLAAALASGGIGLSSIRERAERLGGRAEFCFQPLQGAEVMVTFPAPAVHAAAPQGSL